MSIQVSVSGGTVSANVTTGIGPQGPAGPQGPVGPASVASVNSQTGTVVLTSSSVSAASAVHGHVAADIVAGIFDLARIPTHTHSIAQVSGLQSSLDGKASLAATNVLRVETLNGLNGALTVAAGSNVTVATQGATLTISAAGDAVSSVNGKTGAVVLTSASVSAASAVHTHVTSDITGFTAAAAAAAPVASVNGSTGTVVLTHTSVSAAAASHTHSIAQVSGLQAELDGKAAAAATNVERVVSLGGLTGAITLTGVNLTVATAAGSITLTAPAGGGGGGDVASVNGITGAVVLTHTSVSAAAATHAAQHMAGGTDLVLPVVTSATITASANNYSPPTGDIVRLVSSTATAVISGLSGGASGAVRLLVNVSTNTIRLAHASSDSGATNRFSIAGGADLDLAEGESASAFYDSTSERWRVTGGSGGGGSTSAGGIVSVNGYTATAVTLTSGDVTAASTSHMTTHRAGGSDELLPLVTSVSLTASVNDYSLPTGDIFRLSHTNTNTVSITGLATAVGGSSRLLINVSTGASSSYTIRHQNTNSTAASRVMVPWSGDYIISPNGGAALVIYDSTDSRWRVV